MEVEQLIDVFYVLKRDGRRLTDEVEMEQIRQTLKKIIEPEEDTKK